MAGQAQDGTVAAVDVVQDVAAQGDVVVEGKERDDAQQGGDPGKGAARVQPSRRHDGWVAEGLAYSDVPAATGD